LILKRLHRDNSVVPWHCGGWTLRALAIIPTTTARPSPRRCGCDTRRAPAARRRLSPGNM